MNERLYGLRRRWLNLCLHASKPGGYIYECSQWWDGSVTYRLVADCPNEDALYAAKWLLEG